MKILGISIISFNCVLFSRTKNTANLITPNSIYYSEKVDNVSLAGTWILISKSGGFAGTTIIPSDDVTISFDRNGNYQTTLNESIKEAGSFYVALEKTIYYEDKIPALRFSTIGKNYFYAVALSNDSLSLSDNNYDGFRYLYVKQK